MVVTKPPNLLTKESMNMADCTTVFETLKGFLPMNILEKAIRETGTDQETKKFTALRQLNTLMYARSIVICFCFAKSGIKRSQNTFSVYLASKSKRRRTYLAN